MMSQMAANLDNSADKGISSDKPIKQLVLQRNEILLQLAFALEYYGFIDYPSILHAS